VLSSRDLLLLSCLLLAAPLRAEELPPGACAQFGSHRFYHGPGLSDVVLSADGSRIASVARYEYFGHISDKGREAYDRTIILWNGTTGERIREFLSPKTPSNWLAMSSDGKLLAVGCNSMVVVFDVDGNKPPQQISGLKLPHVMRFSADAGQLFVTEFLESVTSIDLTTGKRLKQWKPPRTSDSMKADEGVCDFVLSPDGKLIAWKVEKKPDYSQVPPGVIPPLHVPEPTVLFVTDTSTDKVLYRKEFERDDLATFVFAPDGRRFFAGHEHVTAYEARTGKEQFSLNIPSGAHVTPSPDSKHAVIVSGWSEVQLWDLETRVPLFGLSPGFVCMYYTRWAFSGDGKALLMATDTTLRLFDSATGKERSVVGHRYPPTVRFADDGRKLVSSCPEARCAWDLAKQSDQALITRQLRKPWEVLAWSYSADDRYELERPKGKVRVLETATGQVVSNLEGATEANLGLISQDANRVMLWNWMDFKDEPEGVRLYDAKTGKKTGRFKPLDVVGYHPVLSPDGRYIAWANKRNGVTLYDATSGEVEKELQSTAPLGGPECNEATIFFSPGSEYLIVTTYFYELFAKPEEIKKWHTFPTRVFEIATGKEISRFYVNPEKASKSEHIACAACASDKRLLAFAEEESGAIRLFDLVTGKEQALLVGHHHGVRGLAFSPDGTRLASGGMDNVVYVWDVAAMKKANGR